MATRRNRFEGIGDEIRETMTEAATAPAGIRGTGNDRLAALKDTKSADAELPTSAEGQPSTVDGNDIEVALKQPSEHAPGTDGGGEVDLGESPGKPSDSRGSSANRKPTQAKGSLKPTPGWTPDKVLTNTRRDEDDPAERATYTAPKGLLDQLRDLDMRAKALGLPPVSRRELATETAKRILNNPAAAIATFKASGWTKGGGQLQPIFSTELAQELDRTLARNKVRQPGPLVGVIAAQVATEIDAWLTQQESEAPGR
jgi:hypothetical protein